MIIPSNTVALIGNPNCGKTTLFNALTGLNQMVGNWPGVTVERKEGLFTSQETMVRVVDLPGIYSFVAHSEDERVSRDYVLSQRASLVVNVIDSTNLERNLYLTVLLREMGIPVLVALNMWDLAKAHGVSIDVERLAKELGVPVVPVSAVQPKDVASLKNKIVEIITHNVLPANFSQTELSPVFASALESLGGPVLGMVALESGETAEAKHWLGLIEQDLGDTPQVLLAEARYRFIDEVLLRASMKVGRRHVLTERLDAILLNRWAGLPLFFLSMYLVFWTTIHFGGAFIDFFDIAVGAICVDGVRHAMQMLGLPAIAIVVVADGIGGGVRTLSTFIPIIFVLFLMLSILEDSGYMARAAFIMDRFMRFLGLPGKAFVPLLVGFGCTVPAILATRTLENRRDRVMTILMAPFMSCGAKMPVYALFAVAFFPKQGQNAVFLLYLAGIVVAIGTGLMLKRNLFRGEPTRFVMELPPYHFPNPYGVVRHSWHRLKDFILKAGKILIVVMAILGTLNAIDSHGHVGIAIGEHSLLASVGLVVAPIFAPLGVSADNWPASVALFMGVFAKEIIVGTLNALYLQQGGHLDVNATSSAAGLVESLQHACSVTYANVTQLFSTTTQAIDSSNPVFGPMRKSFAEGPLQAFSFLIFVLLYVPCVSASSTAAKELGASLTVAMVLYTTGLAWTLSTLFYQFTLGHNPLWITVALAFLLSGWIFIKVKSRQNAR